MKNIRLYMSHKIGHSEELIKQFNQQNRNINIELISSNESLKNQADFILHTFSPEFKSLQTIFNVVNDSNHFKGKTIFLVLNETDGFTPHQIKSLKATGKIIKLNNGQWFDNWTDLLEFIH
jgi:hypothetical protein